MLMAAHSGQIRAMESRQIRTFTHMFALAHSRSLLCFLCAANVNDLSKTQNNFTCFTVLQIEDSKDYSPTVCVVMILYVNNSTTDTSQKCYQKCYVSPTIIFVKTSKNQLSWLLECSNQMYTEYNIVTDFESSESRNFLKQEWLKIINSYIYFKKEYWM